MYPKAIEFYFAPTDVGEVLTLLRQHGPQAKLLAGGQSLMPLMKLRLVEPRTVIDLNRVRGLNEIRESGDVVSIGAMVRHTEIAAHLRVRQLLPIFADAASNIGDPQIRNRGTLAGSLVHADPAANYPAAVMSLRGRVLLTKAGGSTRSVSVDDFFVGPLTTVTAEDELVTAIEIPVPLPHSGGAYTKNCQVAGDFAIVGVATQVTLDAQGKCQQAAIVIGGIMPKPGRALQAAALLRGTTLDETTLAKAGDAAAAEVETHDDVRASAAYRTQLIRVTVPAMLRQAIERARKATINTFPHTSAVGVSVDSGDFAGSVAKVCQALNYDQFRVEQAEAWKQGRYLGVGFCMGVEISGVPSEVLVPMERQPGFGVATVQFDAHGKVQVAEGDSPHGQGHETTIAQAVAGELGISPEDVYITYGDTRSGPFSAGTIGSRGASYTLSAAVLAARALRPKMAQIAAYLLKIEAAEEEFEFRDGAITLRKDRSKSVPIKQVAEVALLSPTSLPPGMEAGLEHTSHFEAQAAGMHSCNVHAAIVEVFPDTGAFKILRYVAVDDAGVPINPMVVRGQIHGGVAMGIGNTCFEEFLYDENGQQLTTTLLDYHIPSALDLPHIEVIEHNVPSPHTPLGSKGKGEGTPGMVPAALANAVEDALKPFDVKITHLPLTAERIWKLIQEAKTKQP